MILDEKKHPVSAKFGPSARHAFRGSSRRCGRRSAATRTIYQPRGQRNGCASPRAGFDIVVAVGCRLASFCCGARLRSSRWRSTPERGAPASLWC